MKHLLIVVLVALLSGCRKDTEPTFIHQFMGDPYTGRVSVDVETPNGDGAHESGKSSLHFTDNAGSMASLVLFGALKDDSSETGDAGFVLAGGYDDNGWRFQKNGMRLEINKSGTISGDYTTSREKYTYTGSITNTSFTLKTTAELLQTSASGYPPGTLFNYEHRLTRPDPAGEEPDNNGGNCRNVHWQMRNVWNPGGGAMSLISVPVCRD